MAWIPGRRHAPDDAASVAAAAALLDVPEFLFFEIAHRRWFGPRGSAFSAVERAFLAYMFARRVPVWALHLARQVTGPGPGPVPPVETEIRRRAPAWRSGIAYSVLIVAALAAVYLAATGGDLPKGCLFPPCY